MWTLADDQISAEAEEAVEQAQRTYGEDAHIDWWLLEQGDEQLLNQGHNVVLVRLGRLSPMSSSEFCSPSATRRRSPLRCCSAASRRFGFSHLHPYSYDTARPRLKWADAVRARHRGIGRRRPSPVRNHSSQTAKHL